MDDWVDLGLSYEEALHAVQSGVAYSHAKGSDDGSPKQLRVGVNSALVDSSALAHLLIQKGLITEEEYAEELRLAMNYEAHRYQEHYGVTFR